MNRELAAHLAWLSELAYETPETIDRALAPLQPCWHFAQSGIEGYIVPLPQGGTALVFRGTQVTADWSWGDVLRNIRRSLTPWSSGGKAHEGYAQGLRDAWHEAWSHLKNEPRPWVYAGHSMGGALATLASTIAPGPDACYTFGAPRVGNRGATKAVKGEMLRIVHACDIAPRYPSILSGYRHPRGGYWHLSRAGTLRRRRLALFDRLLIGSFFLIGIFDHRVGEYVTKLRGAEI